MRLGYVAVRAIDDDTGALVCCPGQPSPIRPGVVLPLCRGCSLLDLAATRGPAPARHDGQRWVCGERRPSGHAGVS